MTITYTEPDVTFFTFKSRSFVRNFFAAEQTRVVTRVITTKTNVKVKEKNLFMNAKDLVSFRRIGIMPPLHAALSGSALTESILVTFI